jgi:hypothetical protein
MSDDDLDRAAILARRQRFIAIALSSLAVACTSRAGKPQACLSPPMPQTEDGSQGEPETPPSEDPPSEDPPAEDPPAEDPPEAPPQPCLKVAPPK